MKQAKPQGRPVPPPDDDPFLPPVRESNEEFEQVARPRRQQGKGQGTKYKVLLASPWRNERNGTEGTQWTEVGRAYPLDGREGWMVYIRANLSVTGTLVIKPDDGDDQ